MSKRIITFLAVSLLMALSACSGAAPASEVVPEHMESSFVESVSPTELPQPTEEQTQSSAPEESLDSTTTPDLTAEPSDQLTGTPEEKPEMKISVTDGQNTVIFQLNDTPAAKSLYDQLPQTLPVENYGGNEKIFYPPDGLDTADAVEGGGSAGGLAYFSPWGNVVMYYGPFGQYPGLYLLGEASSGEDQIGQLTGTITVEAVD